MPYMKAGMARSTSCTLFLGLFALACGMAATQEASLDTLARAGHWKRVRQSVQERSSLPWNEADKAYWQARVKHAFGDLGDAETLVRKAISLDGSNAAYHRELASVAL